MTFKIEELEGKTKLWTLTSLSKKKVQEKKTRGVPYSSSSSSDASSVSHSLLPIIVRFTPSWAQTLCLSPTGIQTLPPPHQPRFPLLNVRGKHSTLLPKTVEQNEEAASSKSSPVMRCRCASLTPLLGATMPSATVILHFTTFFTSPVSVFFGSTFFFLVGFFFGFFFLRFSFLFWRLFHFFFLLVAICTMRSNEIINTSSNKFLFCI